MDEPPESDETVRPLFRAERVGWALVLFCLFGALLTPTLVRWVNPRLAVCGAEMGNYVSGSSKFSVSDPDPWGNGWLWCDTPQGGIRYSMGPDQSDQKGLGDDIVVTIVKNRREEWSSDLWGGWHGWVVGGALYFSPGLLIPAGFLLIWLIGVRARRAAGAFREQVYVSAMIALLLTLPIGGWFWAHGAPRFMRSVTFNTLVPLEWTLTATFGFVCFLITLWVQLQLRWVAEEGGPESSKKTIGPSRPAS